MFQIPQPQPTQLLGDSDSQQTHLAHLREHILISATFSSFSTEFSVNATNLGHVIRFINLSCSWCDLLLCETFYYLTKLVLASPLIGYFGTYLLLFGRQTSYGRIVTRIRSPQCSGSRGGLSFSASYFFKVHEPYHSDGTEAWSS